MAQLITDVYRDHTMQFAFPLIDWFWKYGIKRKGEYQLTLGSWLNDLYSVAENHEALEKATAAPRATLALWGASQTGKSTLLSRYIDGENSNSDGRNSALDWGQPARFSDATVKVDPGVVVFNPFNHQSDGSACVTRFTMAANDGSVDPRHPVQIRFFGQRQLLHALAAGFLTECNCADDRGRVVYWNEDEVEKLLVAYPPTSTPPDQAAYELLRDMVEVLQTLSLTKDDRYRNLQAGNFSLLRKNILETSALVSSRAEVIKFAAKMLWNSWQTITDLFEELLALRTELAGRAGTKGRGELRIGCSLSVAALLVDFVSYPNLLDAEPRTVAKVRALRLATDRDRLVITDAADATGGALVPPGQEKKLALLQALTWELTVPLRKDVLAAQSPPLHALLLNADLLDIPGTANEDEAAEKQLLTEESLRQPAMARKLFGGIIKRGKTSSLVLSSARNFDIDGFSILAKWASFVGKQKQLDAGVDAWWTSYLGRSMSDATGKQLPLNFVVTFLGKLVSTMVKGGNPPGPAFESFFGKLGPLRDPRLVSNFTTTYRHIPDGRIEDVMHPGVPVARGDLERVYGDLCRVPEFNRQFIDGNWQPDNQPESNTIWQAIFTPDGGTDYLLRKLQQDAASTTRRVRLGERLKALRSTWQGLIDIAWPEGGNEQAIKDRFLNEWQTTLQKRLDELHAAAPAEDAAQKLSHSLRTFLHVEQEGLLPVPVQLDEGTPFDDRSYLVEQLNRWKGRWPDSLDLAEVGIPDAARAVRLRGYLCEAVVHEENGRPENGFRALIRTVFGNTPEEQAAERRSFLALRLARALSGGDARRSGHRVVDQERLQELFAAPMQNDDGFDYLNSPHYRLIVYPFFQFLCKAREVSALTRPRQAGDEELRAFFPERN